MKRLLSILLVLCIAASAMGVVSAASLNGLDICPLMITEVAVWPGENVGRDVGELVEVYNNTDSNQDLYYYEMIFTTRRHRESNAFMAPDKFRGGVYLANEQGKFVLRSGEVAVLWLITDESQKECTEAELRETIVSVPGATPIPAGTQIIRIDTTDPAVAFGKDEANTYEPCVRRDGVCYAMINNRDAHKTAVDANYGAFVRVYGQTGKGRSQTYALPTNDDDEYKFEKWQDDITGTTGKIDDNFPMSFGILAAAQKTFFPKAYPTPLMKNVVAGTETVTDNLWLMITEVAAVVADVVNDEQGLATSITNDFGQLVEVYNNTSVEQDLYDYEMIFTSQRNSEPSQFMRNIKFRGGFYFTNEEDKTVLKPGELAVIWIVFNDEQKAATEEGLRAFVAAKEGAAAIPAGTKIVRIDVTAEGTAFGRDMIDETQSAYMPYVSRVSTCYTMINKRDAHVGGPESDAANYGAFVRNYGQLEGGKSQTFGLAPHVPINNQTFSNWQDDITKTAVSSKGNTLDNVPMNMGTLSEGQPEIFRILYTDPTVAIAAAKEAIGAIGEITMDNYTEKKEVIDAAQAAYDALVNAYEDNRSQVGESSVKVLKAAHEAYDNCAAAAAKAADIAAVEKAIDDIGEITVDNYVDKKAAIESAESSRDALKEKYGEAVLGEIKNLSALQTARDAYEGFVAAGGKLAEIAVLKKAIDDLGEITAENYTEKKAAIEAAESARDALKEKYGDAVLGEVDNLEKLNTARTAYDGFVKAAAKAADIAAVEKAITDIGEVTANNYTQKKTAIEAAESARDALKEKYGDAVLGEVGNLENLNTARTAYDGFVAAKTKAADIAAVERAITDIGEVTADNYAGKKTAIEAAESARDALKEKYGDAVLGEVANIEALNAAREAYDKFVEEVMLGDVNKDGDIDASDALLALQHSVKLIELEGDRFKAADVNRNGTVDATDALLMLQYSVHLITEFPKA